MPNPALPIPTLPISALLSEAGLFALILDVLLAAILLDPESLDARIGQLYGLANAALFALGLWVFPNGG